MRIQTLCILSIFMVTLMTASGLRVKKQAGICAAAGIPSVSTEVVVDGVEEVVEQPKAVDEVVAFVEETTIATPQEVAEIVNEVAQNPIEAQELTELIAEVVTIVEVEEQQISTGTAIEAATEVVEGNHNTAEVIEFIEGTTIATPEEIAEFVTEVTTTTEQAEALTEVLIETIEVVEVEEQVITGGNGEGIYEESGEGYFITEVGEPVYFTEETRPEIAEEVITGGNGQGIPPAWIYEEGTVITEVGEPVYFTEETQEGFITGGNGQGIPPVVFEETIEQTREIISNPEAVEEVAIFIGENTIATPEEVAEFVTEVTTTHEEAEELAELIAEVVTVVEVEEQQISTGTAIEAATEVVEGNHNTAEVVNFLEETTIATPEEIAEFVIEVTTTPEQAEALTEVLIETIEVVEVEESGEATFWSEVGEPVYFTEETRPEIAEEVITGGNGEGVYVETLPFPLPTPVIDDTPQFCH